LCGPLNRWPRSGLAERRRWGDTAAAPAIIQPIRIMSQCLDFFRIPCYSAFVMSKRRRLDPVKEVGTPDATRKWRRNRLKCLDSDSEIAAS
jgi:hypothetical protein